MIKNVIYFSGSVLVFLIGVLTYGIILNTREYTLTESMLRKGLERIEKPHIVIDRSKYRLMLYSDTVMVKSYKVVFGRSNGEIKTSAEDYITPKGNYYICNIADSTRYHKLLMLNFPNCNDAAEALRNHIIRNEDYVRIAKTQKNKECPPANTVLGANIGIHGIGEYDFIFRNLPFAFNWTNGSIALSNDNIDELFGVVDIGTEVEIRH